jgi:hypothetical protein
MNVPGVGLEPTRYAPTASETATFANFAIRALRNFELLIINYELNLYFNKSV